MGMTSGKVTISTNPLLVKAFCTAVGAISHPSIDAGKSKELHSYFVRHMHEKVLAYFAEYEAEHGQLTEGHDYYEFLKNLRAEYGPAVDARIEQAKAEQAEKVAFESFMRQMFEEHKAKATEPTKAEQLQTAESQVKLASGWKK